jgi:hypothetical protein
MNYFRRTLWEITNGRRLSVQWCTEPTPIWCGAKSRGAIRSLNIVTVQAIERHGFPMPQQPSYRLARRL